MTTREPRMVMTRRAAMSSAVATACASALAGPASARTLDLNDPVDARSIYRKMRYRLDDGLIFAWIKGPHFGEQDANLTPMFGLNLGAIQRVTHHADGTFEVRDFEISFTTDLVTGKRLTEYKNPFTSELVNVPLERPRPATVTYDANNDLKGPFDFGTMHLDVSHFPVTTFAEGDRIFVRDRTRGEVTIPGQAKRVLNELSTLSAPKAIALDPAVACVKADVQSNDVTGWPAWLKMGSTPGLMALYAVGAKVEEFSEMPADWLEMLHEVWPDIAADPIAALDAGSRT